MRGWAKLCALHSNSHPAFEGLPCASIVSPLLCINVILHPEVFLATIRDSDVLGFIFSL